MDLATGARQRGPGRWPGGGWFGRVRSWMSGGETGMRRLLDLHAASIAGDTLLAVGLAGTIFFTPELGEARGRVALYLLVTMVPFAVLSPLIGPLLDHFRHGRRYALAATMLGRAALAALLTGWMDSAALYPAAFGVLVLSRAYGVARAAAVPRLLPASLTLSQVNARGSVYGTIAGLLVLPIGLAAYAIGAAWPLWVAVVIFLAGMVVALRLPPRADSERPESLPRLFRLVWLRRGAEGERVFTGRLVTAALVGSVVHRAMYGFLLVFLAFTLRADDLSTQFGPVDLSEGVAVGLVSGILVAGTFLAVLGGSRIRIQRPMLAQAIGLLLVAAAAVGATLGFTLPLVALLCLAVAVSSGLAKLAVDSSLQERVDERLRATAFAHSETLLMLAFVTGAAIGLIPFAGQVGVGIATGLVLLAAARAVVFAVTLRQDLLTGRPAESQPDSQPGEPPPPGAAHPVSHPGAHPTHPAAPAPDSWTGAADTVINTPPDPMIDTSSGNLPGPGPANPASSPNSQ